jgi:hypothetical protein
MSNLDKLMAVYRENLKQAVLDNPEDYWPISELDIVLGRIRASLLRHGFNKDSKPFRKSLRQLGIKDNWVSINTFIFSDLTS